MKRLIIICFILHTFSSLSQNVKQYTGGLIKACLVDGNAKILVEKPLGKNVTVVYDTFFQSYKIRFTDEEGKEIPMKFSFHSHIADNLDKYVFEDLEEFYFIEDQTSTKGKIIIVSEKTKWNDKLGTETSVAYVILNLD